MSLTRGERFIDARTVHNKNGHQTMAEVANATKIQKSMIAALEDDNSKRSVGYDKVAILAMHYGVSLDWLLGLTEIRTTNATVQSISHFTGVDDDIISALHLYSHPDKLSVEPEDTQSNPTIRSVFINAKQKKDLSNFSAQLMIFINKILCVIVANPRLLSSHFSQFADLMEKEAQLEEKRGPATCLELNIAPQVVEDMNTQGFEPMPFHCAAGWHLDTLTYYLKNFLYKEINIERHRNIRKKRAEEYTEKQ